jgi:diguanylate cyclase (GGDEF)-like protein
MSESNFDEESTPSPYISETEDKVDASRLKADVAHQVFKDIRQEAQRKKLIDETSLKNIFDERSKSTLPDYQAAQIVDLEEKATRDSLTGLLNRREFDRLFREFLQQTNESGQLVLFLMIDIDYFKKINDTYGHLIGDQVLKYLARALTDSVKIGDLVARWGGEEFTIAIKSRLGRTIDQERLLMASERIRHQIVDLLSKDRYQLKNNGEEKLNNKITLSVGATIVQPGDTLETIYQRADDNLYKAKDGGRDQTVGDNGKINLVLPPDVLPGTLSS